MPSSRSIIRLLIVWHIAQLGALVKIAPISVGTGGWLFSVLKRGAADFTCTISRFAVALVQ